MEVESIARFDPERLVDRLKLVRHVVALANAGGGRIVLGVRADGGEPGVAPTVLGALGELDPGSGGGSGAGVGAGPLTELVNGFVRPDRVELSMESRPAEGERVVVEIGVRAAPEPPLVLGRAGVYDDANGTGHTVFPAHSIPTRRNGRTDLARRDDVRRWRHEAVSQVRASLEERLALLLDAPLDARVRVLADHEVRDEPSYFLSRSVDLFRLQAERLLPAPDLVYLWLNRNRLHLDDEASELIVQSALRKRATLYPWLAVLPVSGEQVRRYLFGAVAMKDRDKSDAARAMLLVCARYFGPEEYQRLVGQVGQSSYAHMRSAAAALPTWESARAQLDSERLIPEERGQQSAGQLLARIDDILATQGAGSRRVPALGLELLDRRLEAGGPDKQ